MAQKPPNRLNADCPAIGIDEAGRGCLAGPVVAAAVLVPGGFSIQGLADSKKLTPARREKLAPQIQNRALAWGLGIIWQQRIDQINILQATFEAMSMAAASAARKSGLRQTPLLIDGNKTIPQDVLARRWPGELPEMEAIIDGDAIVPAISAASVLAKTCRDRIMTRLGRNWPDYRFERHKGYGTAMHYVAIAKLGPCQLHRLTFRGVVNEASQI